VGRLSGPHKDVHTTLDPTTYRLLASKATLYGGMNGAIRAGLERLCDPRLTSDCPSLCPNIKRLRTGMTELDDVLGGGIPEGFVVVVKGSPGAGKTTLCLRFVLEGCRVGERCLYFSFAEPSSHISYMIARLSQIRWEDSLRLCCGWQLSLGDVLRTTQEVAPSRLVLDPIDSISEGPLRGSRSWWAFWDYVKNYRITCFLPEMEAGSRTQTEYDYLSDGLVTLVRRPDGSTVCVTVNKMRLTPLSEGSVSVKLWG